MYTCDFQEFDTHAAASRDTGDSDVPGSYDVRPQVSTNAVMCIVCMPSTPVRINEAIDEMGNADL